MTLEDALAGLPEGPLEPPHDAVVRSALELNWDDLDGSEEEGTTMGKIHRAEDLRWSPPYLTFSLERHGATVKGSTRAELHHWTVDVEAETARITNRTRRQLYRQSKPLKVEPIAQQVADRIRSGEIHETLRWTDPDTVSININIVIPETTRQTTTSRRKRFYEALDELLQPEWTRTGTGRWMKYVRKSE
jgi:hypothetical protein